MSDDAPDESDTGVRRDDGRAKGHEIETVKSGHEVQIRCPKYGELPPDATVVRISSLDKIGRDVSVCPICGTNLSPEMGEWANGGRVDA